MSKHHDAEQKARYAAAAAIKRHTSKGLAPVKVIAAVHAIFATAPENATESQLREFIAKYGIYREALTKKFGARMEDTPNPDGVVEAQYLLGLFEEQNPKKFMSQPRTREEIHAHIDEALTIPADVKAKLRKIRKEKKAAEVSAKSVTVPADKKNVGNRKRLDVETLRSRMIPAFERRRARCVEVANELLKTRDTVTWQDVYDIVQDKEYNVVEVRWSMGCAGRFGELTQIARGVYAKA